MLSLSREEVSQRAFHSGRVAAFNCLTGWGTPVLFHARGFYRDQSGDQVRVSAVNDPTLDTRWKYLLSHLFRAREASWTSDSKARSSFPVSRKADFRSRRN